MLRHVLLATIVLVGCTATVRTAPPPAGPPPAAPPPSAPPPAAPPPPSGPPPVAQEHSDYLQALSDLRAARRYLRRPQGLVVKWDEKIAIQEIDNAIRLLKDAAIDDGHSLDETPPTDTPTWGGRLDRALQLVLAAQKDAMRAEERHDPVAIRIQKTILQHIGNAKRYIQAGIDDAKTIHEPPPQQHSEYLQALSDLRAARRYLRRPQGLAVKWDEKIAIQEIDNAIRLLKDAAIDDGQSLDDTPPTDTPTWGGRLDRALQLVLAAQKDAMNAEEHHDPLATRIQKMILQHIGNAKRYIQMGIDEAKTIHEPPPPPPAKIDPAYLRALSDMRTARAFLEKPTHDVDVKWDETKAIGEIDAAISSVRAAAIDDGKPVTEHAPIDVKLKHRDRLKQAVDLLEKSVKDLSGREDGFSKAQRHDAAQHIRTAIQYVKEAIEDRRDDHGHKH